MEGSIYDVDVQNIMTHEVGHWLKLLDLYDEDEATMAQTMYGRSAERDLTKRSLACGDEAGIVAVFAGQHRELDPAFARQNRQPFDAVFPPIEAAQQAHDDDLGVRGDSVDPQIDRHWMAQIAQMGEAQGRYICLLVHVGRGQSGQITVGERQDRDRARLQTELEQLIQGNLVSRWRQEVSESQYQEILESLIARRISPHQAVKVLLNGGETV